MEILPYIFLASFATILTRFLPLLLFKKKTASPNLAYLQKNSGLLIMVVLTIYALKTMLRLAFRASGLLARTRCKRLCCYFA